MFHINDIIEKAKSRYETLLNITDTIEQKGYWNKTQSIHDNVEEHILSLYLQLV